MSRMFSGAASFNQPLSTWEVGHVTTMGSMFSGASSFNQPLSTWNVSQVTDMSWMFIEASSFNQPLSTWNVSQVTDMSWMFNGATSFNQPLSTWDVGHVNDMSWMFNGAESFNQPLDTWGSPRWLACGPLSVSVGTMPRMELALLAAHHVAFTLLSCLSTGFNVGDDTITDLLLSGTGDLRAIFHSYPDDENSLSFFRWEHNADFFELNFRHFDWLDRPVRMLEIGVLNGGSPYVWHEFFRRVGLRFVGIDILPACKVAQNLDMNIHIEIGSQSDPDFLREVCEKYGPFDVVVDAGVSLIVHFMWGA